MAINFFIMHSQSLFLKLSNLSHISIRTCSKLPEGIKYYGFTYYPRHENFKDPPCTPSKLFLVKRIKSMKGKNPVEKQILAQLNLDGDKKFKGNVSIVKNIPTTNALLWKVKHLVEIKPITWTGELPKEDFSGTYLRDTGELKISPVLKVSPERLKSSEKSNDEKSKLTIKYFKEYLKNQWLKKGNYVV